MKAEEMLKHLKSVVFPQLASLTDEASSFGIYMRGAECKINKPSLLVEAVNLKVPVAQRSGIDQMEISQQNRDLTPSPFPSGKGSLLPPCSGRVGEGLFESLLAESFAQ